MDDLNLVSFLAASQKLSWYKCKWAFWRWFFLSFIIHHHDSSINDNIDDYHRDSFSREGASLGHPRLLFNLGGEEGVIFFPYTNFLFVPNPILAPAENFLMALQLEWYH